MTGKALRRMRLARGLSTAACAKTVRVSRRSWVRWEADGPPAPIALLIAELWREPVAPRAAEAPK